MKKVQRIHTNPQLLISRFFASPRPSDPLSLMLLRSLTSHSSWGFRGLYHAEQSFLTLCMWKIGSGSHNSASHCQLNGQSSLFCDNVPIQEATTLKVDPLAVPNDQGWDILRIPHIVHSPRQIQGMELPRFGTILDTPYQTLHPPGKYTTNSGNYFIISLYTTRNSQHDPSLSFDVLLNALGFEHHVQIETFISKLWHNGLTVNANLSRRGFTSSDLYMPNLLPSPKGSSTSVQNCSLAYVVWLAIQVRFVLQDNVNTTFYESLIAQVQFFRSEDGIIGHSLPTFIATLWDIQCTRNGQMFRQTLATPQQVQHALHLGMTEHQIFTQSQPYIPFPHQDDLDSLRFIVANICQSLIVALELLIQIDDSRSRTTWSGSIVWFTTNAQTSTRQGHGQCIYASSVISTEAQALCTCADLGPRV